MTTEVVFYRIKADQVADFTITSSVADAFLQTRKGFLSRTVKQDHNDASLFLDIVEWQTLEDALSAAQASQKEPSLAPFFEAFEEVISFNHLHPFA